MKERHARQPSKVSVSIPLAYVTADDQPASFANHFSLLLGANDEWVLTVGQAVPPPLVGEPDKIREEVSRIPFVPIRLFGRFVLTQSRLEELRTLIDVQLTARADDPEVRDSK